jgi:16S rRNA (uracil1498-N3)-methyltransferase
MPRFYIPQKVTGDAIFISDADQLHHIRDVLRLKSGDNVTVFDTESNEYLCTITSTDRNRAQLEIQSRKQASSKPVRISIACAIPRKAKMDEIIDKLAQLDIDTVIPLQTERTVVKLEGENSFAARRERWEKIAKSAAEQSQRSTLPVVSTVTKMADVMRQSAHFDLKLIATLEVPGKSLKDVLVGPQPSTVLALIGPEGDFTGAEVQKAVDSGFIVISLGRTVLRVDTAAVAVASYLRFALLG